MFWLAVLVAVAYLGFDLFPMPKGNPELSAQKQLENAVQERVGELRGADVHLERPDVRGWSALGS